MAGIMRKKWDSPATLPVGQQVPETPATPVPVTATVASAPKDREGVRLSFRIPRGLHTRLKLEAVRRQQSIVALVEDWIGTNTLPA